MKKNKKERKVMNRNRVLFLTAAVCFYIVSIIEFLNRDNSMGTLYLCLGSCQLCLASTASDNNKK